jgi:hypothetical protein
VAKTCGHAPRNTGNRCITLPLAVFQLRVIIGRSINVFTNPRRAFKFFTALGRLAPFPII